MLFFSFLYCFLIDNFSILKTLAIVELVPTLMIDDAETKMRTNAAVRVELKTWVLSPQNSGMQNSGCFRLFVLDLGFSMFVFIVLSDLRD
jgi:hypothetical protein